MMRTTRRFCFFFIRESGYNGSSSWWHIMTRSNSFCFSFLVSIQPNIRFPTLLEIDFPPPHVQILYRGRQAESVVWGPRRWNSFAPSEGAGVVETIAATFGDSASLVLTHIPGEWNRARPKLESAGQHIHHWDIARAPMHANTDHRLETHWWGQLVHVRKPIHLMLGFFRIQ